VKAALDVPQSWNFIGYFCIGQPLIDDDAPELERSGWEHRRGAAALRFRR
jgi:5,6-dimethylbenzimidazole synthase